MCIVWIIFGPIQISYGLNDTLWILDASMKWSHWCPCYMINLQPEVCKFVQLSTLVIWFSLKSLVIVNFVFNVYMLWEHTYLAKPPWIARSIFVRTKFSILDLGKMYYNYNCIMPKKENEFSHWLLVSSQVFSIWCFEILIHIVPPQ